MSSEQLVELTYDVIGHHAQRIFLSPIDIMTKIARTGITAVTGLVLLNDDARGFQFPGLLTPAVISDNPGAFIDYSKNKHLIGLPNEAVAANISASLLDLMLSTIHPELRNQN